MKGFILNKVESPWHSASGQDDYLTHLFLNREQAKEWIEKDIAEHIQFYQGGHVCPYGYFLFRDSKWQDELLWTPEKVSNNKLGRIEGRYLWFVHPQDAVEFEKFKDPRFRAGAFQCDWFERHDVIELTYWGHEIDIDREIADRKAGIMPAVKAEDPYK